MDCEAAAGSIVLESTFLSDRGRVVLDGVGLEMRAGEVHALVAGQGEGKTSLCNVLAGSLVPERGRLWVDGAPRDFGRKGREPGRDIALVTSSPRVFPSLSLADNLIICSSRPRNGWFFARRRRLAELQSWLDENGLALPLSTPLFRLYREDWLFVEILNRLHHRPRLLILDEAFEALSPARRRELWPLLRKSLSRGMSILWATGKPEEVLASADRISVMRWGRILLTDEAGNLDRLNIIRLCHSQLDGGGGAGNPEAARERFYQMMRFTEAMLLDIPSAVILFDSDLSVRFANRGAFHLFDLAEVRTRECGLAEFMGSGNARLVATIREAAGRSGEGEWHSLPLASGGREFLIDMRMRPIAEGRVRVGFMLVLEDVSMREELRRRLALSENLASVGLLAAGVAHEVNNPLEVIGNYLNYLKKHVPGGDAGEALEQIGVEAKRIQGIVQNLVAFSGRPSRKSARTDIAGLSRDICSLVSFQTRNRSIEIVCQGGDSELPVSADPGEMRQLLINLLLNSIDALAGGGMVRVSFARRPAVGVGGADWVELCVEDNGPGIALERIDDVFLPFVSTKVPDGRHQGLGLSIVYGIVENCGGRIKVENLPAGGCRFSMLLPPA